VVADGLEIHARADRVIFAFPTNDGLFAVFVAWPIAEQRVVQADLGPQFMAAVDLVPHLAERVRGGRQEERFYGATNLPNFLRTPSGPGWALVGDAGCHKDPYLALGICDAFRDAELLADAVDAGLSGRQPLDVALADYERQRNEVTLPDYRMNLGLAQFAPPSPEMVHLHAALQGNQEEIDRYMMVNEGLTPPEEFFNPENLRRIMAAAAASAR
jgi:flavin-dependent dehydrogenase